MKSCFFIGHEDDVPKHLEQRLESTVEQLIKELFVEEYVRPQLPPGFDQVYLPPELEGMPPRQADDRLDRLLVEQATHLVACVSHFSWDSYRAFADARGRAARGELFLFTLV